MKKNVVIAAFLAFISLVSIIGWNRSLNLGDRYESTSLNKTSYSGDYSSGFSIYLEADKIYTINATSSYTYYNYNHEYVTTYEEGEVIIYNNNFFTIQSWRGAGAFSFTPPKSGVYYFKLGGRDYLYIQEGRMEGVNEAVHFTDYMLLLLILIVPICVFLIFSKISKSWENSLKLVLKRVLTFKWGIRAPLFMFVIFYIVFICVLTFSPSIDIAEEFGLVEGVLMGFYMLLFFIVNIIVQIIKRSKKKKFNIHLLNYLKTSPTAIPITELEKNFSKSSEEIIEKITALRSRGKIIGNIQDGMFIGENMIRKANTNSVYSAYNSSNGVYNFNTTITSRNNPQPVGASSSLKSQDEIDQKHKIRLFGMIKAYKKLDLEVAAKSLHLPEETIQNLIFDLLGENKINGTFNGKLFVFTGEVDSFLEVLDNQFEKWAEKEAVKEGKVVDLGSSPSSRSPVRPIPITENLNNHISREALCPFCNNPLPNPEAKFCFSCGKRI